MNILNTHRFQLFGHIVRRTNSRIPSWTAFLILYIGVRTTGVYTRHSVQLGWSRVDWPPPTPTCSPSPSTGSLPKSSSEVGSLKTGTYYVNGTKVRLNFEGSPTYHKIMSSYTPS